MVVSTTIDKYVYVMVNLRLEHFGGGVGLNCAAGGHMESQEPFVHRIRISYSLTENVAQPEEIQHPIVREALLLLNVREALDISTLADIPSGTGLGSSSTFAVALLHALHELKGETVEPEQLAQEAFYIEVGRLRRPIGKQDHYAAAFGGLNCLEFSSDDRVTVRRLNGTTMAENIFSSFMLFYTHMRRDAGVVLTEQNDNMKDRMVELLAMRDHAQLLAKMFTHGTCPQHIGELMHETWYMKRSLASTVTTSQIDGWYDRARSAGAWGGKLCGAGGGGFLLLIAPQGRHAAIRAALQDLTEMPIHYVPHGSQILVRKSA